ncbi:hypothetical protein FRC18_005705 [Serendipita sp. 400]|nr:hypothetical protein FRC18_005705 [Serendipita sp. 400]
MQASSSGIPPTSAGSKSADTSEIIAIIHKKASSGRRRMDPTSEWDCNDCEDEFYPQHVKERNRWSGAAYRGDWDEIFSIVAEESTMMGRFANSRRLYTKKELQMKNHRRSGYTVLHQAAYCNASEEIIGGLVALGCYRRLASKDGRPVDIARARGFTNLIPLLEPPPDRLPNISDEQMEKIQTHLNEVVKEESRNLFKLETMTMIDLKIFREVEKIWMPVPGMYGGFDLSFDGDHLVSQSHCRVVGGSGMTYHITAEEAKLVDSGWG